MKGLKVGRERDRPWPVLLSPAEQVQAYLYPQDVEHLSGKDIQRVYMVAGDRKRYPLSKAERECFVGALKTTAGKDQREITLLRDLEMVCINLGAPGVSTGPMGIFPHTFPAGSKLKVTIENQHAGTVVDGMLWTCAVKELEKSISN